MKPHSPTIVLSVLLASAVACDTVAAQPVYRCGNSYSQTPCANGQGREVQVDDARSPAQKADAQRATERSARAADALEKTRVEEEKRAETQRIAEARTAEKARAAEARRKAQEEERAEKRKREEQIPYQPALRKPKPPKTGKPKKPADFLATQPVTQP